MRRSFYPQLVFGAFSAVVGEDCGGGGVSDTARASPSDGRLAVDSWVGARWRRCLSATGLKPHGISPHREAEAYRPTRPKERSPPWENAANRGLLCEVFGRSLAGGQLVFAASERMQFDPSFNLEEQEDIASRIIENCPTLTRVADGQSSSCATRSSCDAIELTLNGGAISRPAGAR